MAPIGVAIIGGGIFAKEQYLPAVAENSKYALKAVYSRSTASAQAVASLVPSSHSTVSIYSDENGSGSGVDNTSEKSFAALLRRDDITAVIIALPILNQPAFIRAALTAGKHVLAEKPVAADVTAAEDLIKWYRDDHLGGGKSSTWAVAENFRYIEKYVWAAEQVRALGAVTGVAVRVMYYVSEGDKYFNTPWRNKPEFRGGFILDAGVHWAAAMRLMLGENPVVEVSGRSATVTKHIPPPDTLLGTLKLKSGAIGTVHYSVGSSWRGYDYTVTCEKGSVRVFGDTVTIQKPGGAVVEERTFEFKGQVIGEVDAWANSLAAGRPDPKQSPEQALADLEFIEALLLSAEEGGTQRKLTLQCEEVYSS